MQLDDLRNSASLAVQLSTRHRASGQSEPRRWRYSALSTSAHAPMTYSKLTKRLELARRLELMFVTAILTRSCVELPRRHRMLLTAHVHKQCSSQRPPIETRFEMGNAR